MLATLALFAGLAGATMNASGESALYGIRVAVEDAAVALHGDPADRDQYLLSLLDARQAEAARLESSGNALAASKVRQIEQDTLHRLQSSLPQAPVQRSVRKGKMAYVVVACGMQLALNPSLTVPKVRWPLEPTATLEKLVS